MGKPISWRTQLDRWAESQIAAQMRHDQRFKPATIFWRGFVRGYIGALWASLGIGLFVLLCWALTP